MPKRYLLTPGPTPLPPAVRQALAEEIIHHRTAEFQEIFKQVNEALKYLFQTNNDVFTFAASGTGAMEAAVVNLLSPGDKAITVSGGKFGERWAELCQAYGIQPIVIDVEWGKPVDPNEIKRLLKANPEAKAVFTTQCETSTAVVNDIKAIGEVVKDTKAVLVVDAISSLGAENLETDNWHVDCAVVGSQKGMMLPPGLAFCLVSDKCWPLIKASKSPKYYFDLQKAKKALEENDTAFTPAISLIIALKQALMMIQQEGLANVFARSRKLAEAVRAGLTALGLKVFGSTFCSGVSAAYVPEGIDSSKLVKLMRTKYGVGIADGQGYLKGKIIRIAHMGYISAEDIIQGISVLADALNELGCKVEKNKGVIAAKQKLT